MVRFSWLLPGSVAVVLGAAGVKGGVEEVRKACTQGLQALLRVA